MAVCAEYFTPDTLDSGDGCNPNRIVCASHLHPFGDFFFFNYFIFYFYLFSPTILSIHRRSLPVSLYVLPTLDCPGL